MRGCRLLALSSILLASCASCTTKDSGREPPALAATSASAAGTMPASSGSSAPTVKASGPFGGKARAIGRHVVDPDGGLRFAWPGTGIAGRFEGTSIGAKINDEGKNLFTVVVDGEVKKVLRTEVKRDVYPLAEGLAPGTHDIAIYKRTEAKVGEVVIYGFEPLAGSKLLPAPPSPERRIELIGDSITTGYGNEGPGAACGYVAAEQNEYLTYGALTARALNADHTTIAWSGKTLYEMRQYFDRALPNRDASRWDFGAYDPQVVVINVGTNNFALIDPGEKRYVELYTALVEKVRAAYPKAFIVCALGPMLTDIYPEGHRNLTQARKYMKVVTAKLKATDPNLDFIEFPEQKHSDGLGCGFHPSLKTHKLMSEKLVPFVKERMGW